MIHLVFLHGLLGDGRDWQSLIPFLSSDSTIQFKCHFLDLPFHGNNKNYFVRNFDDCSQFIQRYISQLDNAPYFLIGYSLGGRLALHFLLGNCGDKGNIQGLVLESTNLGLTNDLDRQLRWEQDLSWAMRFEQESITTVLIDWYKQAIFSHLSSKQQSLLIDQRMDNQGKLISQMLKATSLAKQIDFSLLIKQTSTPVWYFCGEKDNKFQSIAKKNYLNLVSIPFAGHNAHRENPSAFAKSLTDILHKVKDEQIKVN